MMHRRAQRVEIRTGLDASAILLRRRVTLRADHGGITKRREMACDAEVDQLRHAVAGDHHVGRLEVAVNDRRFEIMQIFERREDLQRNLDYSRRRELAAVRAQFILERGAVDILHHEVVMVGFAEAIEDARDVFVGELREHVGLALEGRRRLLLQVGTGEAIDHFRQRAGAAGEPQILREIDQLHAAAAERSNDPIASADYGAGRDHLDAARPPTSAAAASLKVHADRCRASRG